MNKTTKIILILLLVPAIIYPVSYLSLRERDVLDKGGYWVIYFYKNTYVSQYAISKRARRVFNYSVTHEDYSFFAGNEGDIDENWFCVYRQPNSKIYRIYRLAEIIENKLRIPDKKYL